MNATNSVWGTPFQLPWFNLMGRQQGQRIDAPIARQLHTFLSAQLDQWTPDLLVVIERKGTAILRALKEWSSESFEWPWRKVISSDIIDQVPTEFLLNKRILVFDDTVNTGSLLKDLLTRLEDRGIASNNNIRVAVFAVHDVSSDGFQFGGDIVPHAWFYRGLTKSSYHSIRAQIVGMLQEAGSLMLDTEHVEVRVRLRGSFNKFVNALQRNSRAVVFRSSQGRTNITVLYSDDDAHQLPVALFPPDTQRSSIVKKCRIVQRTTDEFAIIPICFPSIATDMKKWLRDRQTDDLLGSDPNGHYKTRFYDVGLLAALEVLRWVLKDLAVWGSENYTLLLPQQDGQDNLEGGYDLEHLRAMYPTLSIGALAERVADIAKQAEIEGNSLHGLKFETQPTPAYTDQELRRDALELLSAVRYVLDQRTIGRGWSNEWKTLEWGGLSLNEIFDLGKSLDWSDDRVSTLFDILIDEATLSTDIGPLECSDGITRIVRTFSPAGEVVSDLVRRYTTQWGLPHEL